MVFKEKYYFQNLFKFYLFNNFFIYYYILISEFWSLVY